MNKSFDGSLKQIGRFALAQNYSNKDPLPDYVDQMDDQIIPHYSNIPDSRMEQNSTFADSVQQAWVSYYASGLAPSGFEYLQHTRAKKWQHWFRRN